ncbi:GPI mannosyltransferase 4, partial [Friedmanniomyces simplex]
MSRRLYLFLVCLRLYFALSPSYIHPDEHFQGPEITTGTVSPLLSSPLFAFLPGPDQQ